MTSWPASESRRRSQPRWARKSTSSAVRSKRTPHRRDSMSVRPARRPAFRAPTQRPFFYEVALLELETRARRTGRETSDCNSCERLGRALD
eukprot:scaffold35810_cov78-Phaeocystis_antarctica.AAC.5